MPLRSYRCASGHSGELLVRVNGDSSSPCPSCGAPVSLSPVNRIAVGYKGKWGSEFVMPSDMRDAHDQAMGWKKEYQEAAREATANGFK